MIRAMQRRRWLQLGLGGTIALATAGAAFAWLTPGLRDGRLAANGRMVMRACAEAVLDGSLPPGPSRAAALDALLHRLDTLIAALPAYAQSELSQLLSVLAATPGRHALAGLTPAWEVADVPTLQAALQGMRISRTAMRRQAYQALHDLSAAAWFSDASTWTQLGYPGPREI